MNPNPFAAHMDALDEKAGRVHTVADWRRVEERSRFTPAALTDGDLVILAYFEGEPAAGARASGAGPRPTARSAGRCGDEASRSRRPRPRGH